MSGNRQPMALDVSEWLRGLGLERYDTAFRENDIDETVLPRLTAEDLREIGVVSVGHRRRLIEAIAALEGRATAAPPPDRDDPGSGVGVAAERRQLTVMFVDLVGSTPLAVQLDPEDLRDVIGAYHRCDADTGGRLGGFAAADLGDGVLIYFGYPRAREADAERAVTAGLALVDAVAALAPGGGAALACRVGIATGLVVVGDLIGAGAAREQAVVGETPNLAARLQALASANTVLIADRTRRLIGGLFDIEGLGPRQLAGFPEPQHVWRVLGESGVISRFEALRSQAAPLVGRDDDLELLLHHWQQAKAGQGRIVLLSGEAGIGKSRLTAALSERIKGEPHARLRYFCTPQHQDSALHPFILQLEGDAGFARDDPAEDRLKKLHALLAPAARSEHDLGLLAELLSLPSTASALSPQRKRELLFEALLGQLEGLARSRPVLMIFEDAHWIDPTSRDLLDLAFERASRLPVLIVVTFRPEFSHGWVGQPRVTTLTLNRLTARDGAALVERLAGSPGLPREAVEEIVERTDGVPLFVEELTKAVLESGAGAAQVADLLATTPAPGLPIPATLHASLIARLDRLGPAAREVAQIGAVLGREFSYELLDNVAKLPQGDLAAALERLVAAGLLFRRGAAAQSSFLFKHALVQDAAYGTLLRARRQELHARVAAVLEQHFADLVERRPELLAQHLTSAGDAARAVGQWLKAGQRAAEQNTHLEALGHFYRGLMALAGLAAGPQRDRAEAELQLARGLSLITTRGFMSPEAAEAYGCARELAEQRGDARQLFVALNGLWQTNVGAGHIRECRRLSHRLDELTAANAAEEMRLQSHHAAWTTWLFAGDPATAHRHVEAGRRIYDPERHRGHRQLYGGHDPGACAGYMGGQVEWLLGYPDTALKSSGNGLALAERLAHPMTLEVSLLYLSLLHLDRREPEFALSRLSAAETLAAEQRLGFAVDPGILHGAALTEQGAFEDAAASLRAALARPGAARLRPYGLMRLAEALTRLGRHDEALAAINEGVEDQERSGQHRWEAELHRLAGYALAESNRLEEGLAELGEALRVARVQQAKMYELRAATDFARLLGDQGRRAEGRDRLAPIYGGFTEGFATADLKRAAALLADLQ